MFAASKACLEPPWHRRFAGCDVNAKRFALRKESLIEMYAKLVLNEKSNISETNKVADECQIVI